MTAQVHFEDVAVGDRLVPLVRGPLTVMHLMRWSAAMENWHRIHYDRPFTQEHEKLPDLMINGTLKQQFIVQLLKDWAGSGGWLWKVSFQFRAMNTVGETLRIWAEVVELESTEAHGVVRLKLGVVNDAGRESTPGTASVVLPRRGGPPVPYPFQPMA